MISLKVHKLLGAAIFITRPGVRKKRTTMTQYDLTSLVLSRKFRLRKFVQDTLHGIACTGEERLWLPFPVTHLYREPADGEDGDHDYDHACDPFLAPAALCRHVASRCRPTPQSQQQPQIQATDQRQGCHVRCSEENNLQRTLVSVDPPNRCCYVFELLASSEFCIFPSAVSVGKD